MTLRIQREKRWFVLCAAIILIIVFGAVFWDTLNITKISGDYYQRIARDKDLIADILPSPEFIMEPYLIMYQMLNETDKAKLEQLAAKSRELRDKYEAVHKFWAGKLPEGKARDELIVASYRPAEEFFEASDKQVIPAILRGDRENAHALIRDLLTPKYEEHRRAIENVVGMVDEAISRKERESAGLVERRLVSLALLAGIGIIGLALLHWRAEKLLGGEVERLAITLRSIGDGVIAADKSGRVLLLNKAAEDLTGWTQEEAADRLLPEIFHIINETTRERCANPVEKVLETGRIVGLANHTLLVAKDGTERNIADSASAIRDNRGRIIGVVLVFRDVTEHKRAEDELRQMNEYLENIFENSPDGIGIVDRYGKFFLWNRMAAEQYGYTSEELRGKSAFDLYPDKDELDRMLTKLRNDGAVKKYPINMKRKDGTVTAFEISISLLKDDENRVIGSVCVARDMSDITKALNDLAVSHDRLYQEITERKHLEEKYRSIYENAIEGIFQITPEGSFLSANPALARILGYDSPEDVLESLTDVSRQLYVYPEQRLELLRQVEERDVVQGFEGPIFPQGRKHCMD